MILDKVCLWITIYELPLKTTRSTTTDMCCRPWFVVLLLVNNATNTYYYICKLRLRNLACGTFDTVISR